jgi:hypothetical protein
MGLVRRLTDFRVRQQALSQCFTFLVWTAINRIRSASPLKRTVLLYVSFLFHWYCTVVICRGYSGWNVKLYTHRLLVTSSKMSGVIPLLPLYVLMAQPGTTLPFIFGCLFEYSVSYQLFAPIPLHVSSSKLYCLICNIFTHAISNTGYEFRINVSYETMNSKHRRKKQSLSILGIFPAFTWMD